MIKQVSFTVLITIVFIVALAFFEFLHWQMKAEVVQVPAQYLQPLDVSLKNSFIDSLKDREGNALGPDLGY